MARKKRNPYLCKDEAKAWGTLLLGEAKAWGTLVAAEAPKFGKAGLKVRDDFILTRRQR